MRKYYLCFLINFSFYFAQSQAPYIGTAGGDGLGQYGYLEKDAVTFSRLFRNTYNNIAYLSARWWITDNNVSNGDGKEFIYNVYAGPDWITGIGWQCGGDNDGSKRTTDFNADDFSPEWGAGSNCYVSVCAKYCDDSYSPAGFDGVSTHGAVGFNERHFNVIDVDTSLHVSTASVIANTGGICETATANSVAGSFSVNPGDFTGISINTLILKNNATALEGTDLPNWAFHVYFEAATGSEIFGDGNETFGGTLYGDWDGNTNDNIFGSNALNIPLNGKVRVYILLCEYNSPTAIGKEINLGIINDGIFLSPVIDGFNKMRINPSGISQRNITLPLKFISFNGSRIEKEVYLKWEAGFSDISTRFNIQESFDGINFTNTGTKLFNQYLQQIGSYEHVLNTRAEYFRIQAANESGEQVYSKIIRLWSNFKALSLLQNPAKDEVIIKSSFSATETYRVQISDAAGRVLMRQNLIVKPGNNKITIPANTAVQMLLLSMQNANGEVFSFKIYRQ